MTPAAELVEAWLEWDAAAARLGAAARAAVAEGLHPPRPPSTALLRETRRLSAAEAAFGAPLGWTARVTALRWRRDGSHNLSATQAVRAVVADLTHPLG